MDNSIFPIHFAPVQGHTDHAYRSVHSSIYGSTFRYYTPFIRVEKGTPRRRDIVDFKASLEENIPVTAQVIFRDMEELEILINSLGEAGAKEIDLNMGCPFPLQTARGRGAAAIGNTPLVEKTAKMIERYPDISFSLKIRLGMNNSDEWRSSSDAINSMRLHHLSVHPRIARQQYKGETDMEEFKRVLEMTSHHVIYNGDIRTPDDVDRIRKRFPEVAGVMCGRGLLARPSLAMEISSKKVLSIQDRISMMLYFHSRLLSHYQSTLQGNTQILMKIAPFWEYAEAEIGRKSWKALKKASTMPKYLTALAGISVESDCI